MKTRNFIPILALVVLAFPARADSLWTDTSGSLFTDAKASKVGDLVTILVAESSSTSQNASTDFKKSLKHDNGAGVGPLLSLIPDLQVSSSQNGASSGGTSRTSQFVTKITAKITQVLPNGNLVLDGTRTMETNAESQQIKLTGTVRPEDISSDNTVLSTYLADVSISSTGKGAVGDRQQEGLISKLIKLLF